VSPLIVVLNLCIAAASEEKAMQAYDAAEMTKTLEQHLAMFKQQRRVTAR